MAINTLNGDDGKSVPSSVADAVLKASAPLPPGSQEVRGVEFNYFRGRNITVEELIAGMTNMGFQASAVSDAIQIINRMVRTRMTL